METCLRGVRFSMAGDWSIFRPVDVFGGKDAVRKHGPVPLLPGRRQPASFQPNLSRPHRPSRTSSDLSLHGGTRGLTGGDPFKSLMTTAPFHFPTGALTGQFVLAPQPTPSSGGVPVLHVINAEHYAGTERVQDLLALGLPARGYRVGFAALKSGRFGEMRRSQDSALHTVAMRSRFDLRAARRIAALVAEHGYALVHTHTPRSALVGALAAQRTGVPLVTHIHSPAAHDTTHAWRNRLNAIIERLAARQASRLVAVSQSLAAHLAARGFDPAKIVVIHNGVPSIPLPDRAAPAGPWTLGTVALFRPRKGIDVLLDALARLVARGLDVRLRAVGPFETPAYEQKASSMAARLGLDGRIVWTGMTRDVKRRTGVLRSVRPPQPLWRGPADGYPRGIGRRRPRRRHSRRRRARSDSRRPRRSLGRAGRCGRPGSRDRAHCARPDRLARSAPLRWRAMRTRSAITPWPRRTAALYDELLDVRRSRAM